MFLSLSSLMLLENNFFDVLDDTSHNHFDDMCHNGKVNCDTLAKVSSAEVAFLKQGMICEQSS